MKQHRINESIKKKSCSVKDKNNYQLKKSIRAISESIEKKDVNMHEIENYIKNLS